MTAKGTKKEDFAYNKEVADEFCERLALGETATDIHKDPNMPSAKVIYKWRQLHPDFEASHARAREDQMHSWSDQVISLVDNAEMGYNIKVPLDSPDLEKIEADGFVHFKFRKHHLAHAQAMAHERKWLMGKLVAMYGDRLQVDANHTFEGKDDSEMLHALQDAARKAGVTPEEMATLLTGEMPVQ